MRTVIWMAAIAAALVTAAAAPASAAGYDAEQFPGIDCRHDDGPAVNVICNSDHLMYLDQEIAERFSRAYASAGWRGKERLLDDQRKFLAIRDGCGRDVGCLSDILHARSDAIITR